MSQHDYSIANQGFPATRADINNALSAIATNNSGTSAPSTQYAGQFWIDTTTSTWTMYIHDGTDDIQFATIDTSTNTVNFIDSALASDVVINTSGAITTTGAFTSVGIDDNATSTAITIDSSEVVRIGNTSDTYSPTYTEHMVIGNYNADEDHGITFLSDLDNTFTLGFADDGHSTLRGAIKYSHLNDFMTFHAFADGERMRITNAGNVGIGTSSPATNLDINGSARVSTGSSYQFGGSDYKIEGSNVTNPRIGFITNSTERMRIDSAGNVGIGTASPAHNVEIVATASGSINDTLQIRNNSGATGTGSRIRFINSTDANSDANGASLGTVRSGDDNAMFFETENAERMRINHLGNVGIGTSSPAFKLEVNKGSAGDIARFTDGVNANTVIKTSGSVTTFGPDTANALALQTNNAERMRIDSAGGVRINNTANATYSAQLNIYSPSTLNCGIHLRTNTGGSQSQILFGNSNNDSVGSIGTSGTSTSFNTSSDYRIKENVNYNFDATTRLKQLKPARFNFIADANTTVDGFLAHEVQDIVPEAITGTKDATETKEKVVLNTNGQVIAQNIEQADWETGKIADEDGNTQYPTDSTWEATKVIPVYQAIDQSKLVPLLVKTIQELEARITALETTN